MADSLNVWVVGDSTMWGQGLRHEDKFAVIAAREIATDRGQTVSLDERGLEFPASIWCQIASERKHHSG